jgi:spore maturation protein CgeB
MDAAGALGKFLDKNNIIHCNWSVDDPFYEEIILTKKFRPARLRFDFVSDKGYVASMRERGYQAHFLPLAVDPSIFFPAAAQPDAPRLWKYETVFVGNSYLRQMDDMLKSSPDFVDMMIPFLGSVVRHYHENVEYDIEGHIERKIRSLRLPEGLSFEKAVYIAKHTAGYLGRKQIVLQLVKRYPGFMVFGEPGWLKELPPERLGTAKYYDSLCDVYRSAKISVDINRMVIRNGFTQRAFDVPASGGFLITSAKPVVADYFVVDGKEKEIVVFRSSAELVKLIDYYLSHEEERLAIAERGRKKVLGAHTYDHRMAEMFGILSKELGKK